MLIYEVTKPGTWIVHEDQDWAFEVESLLRHIEGQFYEANLTLNMFLESISYHRSPPSRDQWQRDSERRRVIQTEIEKGYPDPYAREVHDEIYIKTEIQFKREKWQAGELPREFTHNQSFIYARAFLYALDSFDKFMKVLKNKEGTPEVVAELHNEIGDNFPDLRGVRNTAQHMEDRARGLGAGHRGKPPQQLDLKPIDNQLAKADGGILLLNCLNGTRYGSTMADGHYGEVDVSPDSMNHLHSIFDRLLNAFEWKGPKAHLPSRP